MSQVQVEQISVIHFASSYPFILVITIFSFIHLWTSKQGVALVFRQVRINLSTSQGVAFLLKTDRYFWLAYWRVKSKISFFFFSIVTIQAKQASKSALLFAFKCFQILFDRYALQNSQIFLTAAATISTSLGLTHIPFTFYSCSSKICKECDWISFCLGFSISSMSMFYLHSQIFDLQMDFFFS